MKITHSVPSIFSDITHVELARADGRTKPNHLVFLIVVLCSGSMNCCLITDGKLHVICLMYYLREYRINMFPKDTSYWETILPKFLTPRTQIPNQEIKIPYPRKKNATLD